MRITKRKQTNITAKECKQRGKAVSMSKLINYRTGEIIRKATEEEAEESKETARHNGGAGVILVNDVPCYVED